MAIFRWFRTLTGRAVHPLQADPNEFYTTTTRARNPRGVFPNLRLWMSPKTENDSSGNSNRSNSPPPPEVPGPLLPEDERLSLSRDSSELFVTRPVIPRPVTVRRGVLDFAELEDRSVRYDQTPKVAQEWFKTFGEIKDNTNVSWRFLAENAASSILPMLSRWIRSWFELMAAAKNEFRRRRDQVSKDALESGQADFRWICKYIRDYVEMDHRTRFFDSHVIYLIRNALYVCTKIGEERDFIRVIDVLYTVYSRLGCPEIAAQESIFVLSGIMGHLQDQNTPDNLPLCLDLVTGDRRNVNDFVRILDGILTRDVSQFEMPRRNTHIKAMKGVIKYLTHRLTSNQSTIFQNESLFASLLATAGKGIGEINEQLMALCLGLITEKDQLDQASDLSLEHFVSLVVIIHKNMRESSRQGTPDGGSEFWAQAGSRHSLCDQMVRLLSWVDDRRKLIVFNRFFRLLNDMEANFSLQLLKEVAENIIPSAEGEGDKIGLLLEIVRTFVRNMKMPTEVRQAAVEVIEELAWTEDQPGVESVPWPKNAISSLVEDLIGLIRKEADLNVLGPLVAAAVRVAVRYGDSEFMEQCCKALEFRACLDECDFHGPKAAEVAARGLASVFIESLNTQNDRLTQLSFELLTHAAGSLYVFADARLAAMRTLFRIRCDSSGRIFVSAGSDSELMAAALCRTDETAARARNTIHDQDEGPTTRNSGLSLRRPRPEPPLWMYPGQPALPILPDGQPRGSIRAPGAGHGLASAETGTELKLSLWLECVINCLQKDTNWETYSYVVVHLGAQLSDVSLFEGIITQIQFLRGVVCEKVRSMSFFEPPAASGLKKGDVAQCLFNILTALIAYHVHYEKNGCDELVKAFVNGIGSFEGTSRGCIHALFVCCLEIPGSVTKNLSAIIRKLQTSASQSHLSMHVLEFFAALARLPEVHTNLHEAEIRPIFGICVEYMKSMRDRDSRASGRLNSSRPDVALSGPGGQSGLTMASVRVQTVAAAELPQYVTTLAYHNMIFWFLSLKLSDRAAHVPWIVKSLIFTDKDGSEHIEEQSQVLIDMMQRTAYSDLGETEPDMHFLSEAGGVISGTSWIVGNSILTLETAGSSGWTHITKRQASGTTHSIYQQLTAERPSHHVPITTEIRPEFSSLPTEILPPHVLLQMLTTSSPTSLTNQPLVLPNKEFVKMALNVFDHHPTIDGHKVAVIYIGPGQSKEAEILANTTTSPDFESFLAGLGTKVSLAKAKFNTQGLRAECDGEATYAWRDRVSEIVYHIPSMMPTNLDEDAQCINKKAHIGNDHVTILFNHSGAELPFHTFHSQFNYVNIVVTPACRPTTITTTSPALPRHYKVHTQTAPGFPALSPCSIPKILSATTLPSFVRLIALNACVFSLVWRDAPDPTSPHAPSSSQSSPHSSYPSSWRQRLRDIHALRARVVREAAAVKAKEKTGGPVKSSASRGGLRAAGSARGLYPPGRDDAAGVAASGSGAGSGTGTGTGTGRDGEGIGDGAGKLAGQYDFSRWTEG